MKRNFITKQEYYRKIRAAKKPFTVVVWRKMTAFESEFTRYKVRKHHPGGLTKYRHPWWPPRRWHTSCYCIHKPVTMGRTIQRVKTWTTDYGSLKFKIELVREKEK